jgi:hypothetical protein
MNVVPMPDKAEWEPSQGDVLLVDIALIGECLRELRVLRVEPDAVRVQMVGRWRNRFWLTKKALRDACKGVIGRSRVPGWWPW